MITKELLFRGPHGRSRLQVLFNPENTYSYIREDLAEKIGNISKLPWGRYRLSAFEETLSAEYVSSLVFEINDLELRDLFRVSPDLPGDVIIGQTTLRKCRIKLDQEQGAIITDPRVTEIIIQGCRGYRSGIKNY